MGRRIVFFHRGFFLAFLVASILAEDVLVQVQEDTTAAAKQISFTKKTNKCVSGDVRFVDGRSAKAPVLVPPFSFIPEVYYQKAGNQTGQWYVVCPYKFVDDSNGAIGFCKSLGYTTGRVDGSGSSGKYEKYDLYSPKKTYSGGHWFVTGVDFLAVGQCKVGESLHECTGGGNFAQNVGHDVKHCSAKYSRFAMRLICSGGDPTGYKKSSQNNCRTKQLPHKTTAVRAT